MLLDAIRTRFDALSRSERKVASAVLDNPRKVGFNAPIESFLDIMKTHHDDPDAWRKAVRANTNLRIALRVTSVSTTDDLTYTINNSPVNENLAILQKSLLENVGFTVKIEKLQIADFYQQVYGARNFQMSQSGFNVSSACPYCGLSSVETGAGGNFGNFTSPDMDAALAVLQSAKPGAETSAALTKVQDLWNTEMPTPIVMWLPYIAAVDKKVHGLEFPGGDTLLKFSTVYISK